MATVLVWSERPEPNAPGLRDCTYSSGLMGMVHAGFTAFPKGIYTTAEREALERSDAQPDETGASLYDLVVAIQKRYGKAKTVRGPGYLNYDLGKVGHGMAVQGKLSNFPAGHRLRRWDPNFTGGHCVYVVYEGPDRFRWFDPEATMKYAGEIVTKAQVQKFAIGLGHHMLFRNDEFKPAPVPVPPPTPPTPPPDPLVYTEAQMAAVKADLATANAALATALSDKEALRLSLEQASNNLSEALRKIEAAKPAIDAAKAALGG